MSADSNKNFSLLKDLYYLGLFDFTFNSNCYIAMRRIRIIRYRNSDHISSLDFDRPLNEFIELIDNYGHKTALYNKGNYINTNIYSYYFDKKAIYLPYPIRDLFSALSLIIPTFADSAIEYFDSDITPDCTCAWQPFYYSVPRKGLLNSILDMRDYHLGQNMLCYSDADDVEDVILMQHFNTAETWKNPKTICGVLKIPLDLYKEYYALFDQKLAKMLEKEKQKELSELDKLKNYCEKALHQSMVDAGNKGEQEVYYNLEWLDKNYTVIKSKSEERLGVKVLNPSFKNEAQEIDHIVVGPQGVFLIETKNISGTIQITKSGNWLRKKAGETEFSAMQNPTAQINRHEKVIKSIIQDYDPKIKIINIICLANNGVIIEGEENCSIPIVRADLITSFIESYKSDYCLDQKSIEKVAEKIDSFIV